jgi:predicted nucleic acid-binding protein
MIIVVDTNIVFSAILNTNSTIGDLILNSQNIFQFQSCNFLLSEIDNHWEKLKKSSKLDTSDLSESRYLILKNIFFISEQQIPVKYRLSAYELVKDVDIKDVAFVALNEFQKSFLWTGDKVLIKGLKNKDYKNVITTRELIRLKEFLSTKS